MGKSAQWSAEQDDLLATLVLAAELSQEAVARRLGRSRYLVVRRAQDLGLYWEPQDRYGPRYQDVEVRALRRFAESALTAAQISGARINRSPRSIQRQLKAMGKSRPPGRPKSRPRQAVDSEPKSATVNS